MPIAIKGQYVFRGKAVKGDSIPVGINPCDPPLSAEVIRSIARLTYKNPATAKAEAELGWTPDQKITDVVF